MPDQLSRRSFLSALLAGGAGLGLTPTVLAAVQQAFAVEPTPGSTWEDAEHIVFLMQENRAFDHAFGSLQGVRGFNDPRARTLPGGLPVWCQATATGEIHTPFRLDVGTSRAAWMGDTPHDWKNQSDARNGGRHDRWLPAKARKGRPVQTLGYATRADVPFNYALADAFTICDQHFCSTLTGTTSNRLYFWSGTNRETQTPDGLPHLYNDDSDRSGILRWTSFPERLSRAGVPWKYYQNQLSVATGMNEEEHAWLGNFGLNVLEFFAAYNVRFAPGHHAHLQQQVAELRTASERAAAKPADAQQAAEVAALRHRLERALADVATWDPANFARLSAEQRALHQQAFVTNPDPASRRLASAQPDPGAPAFTVPQGDLLAQFRADVAAGKLPPVSWLRRRATSPTTPLRRGTARGTPPRCSASSAPIRSAGGRPSW